MQKTYVIALALVDPARLPALGHAPDTLFSADGSAAESDAVAARNATFCERLKTALPGLETPPDWRAELSDLVDDDLPVEALLRRHQRTRFLSGPWAHGEVQITLFDDLVSVAIVGRDIDVQRRAAFDADFTGLVSALVHATGFVPWNQHRSAPFADAADAAHGLLAMHAMGLERLFRAQLWHRIRRALGVPSLVVLSPLAAACVAGLLADAARLGTLMAGVDPDSPAFFTTGQLVPVTRSFGRPQFALLGTVGESWLPVQLPVFRAEYIAAGPGARFPVLPTADPEIPYVLRNAYHTARPLLRLGGIGIAWHAVLAVVPATLWAVFVAWPLWRAPAAMRAQVIAGMTTRLVQLIGFLLIIAVGIAIRLLL